MTNFLNELILSFRNYGQEFITKLPALTFALLIFLIFWLAAKIEKIIASRITNKLKNKEKIEVTVLIDRLIRVGVLVLGGIVALIVAGVNLTALFTSLGLVGFALGFALRDLIKNFLAGIIILIQRPFVIGDQIEIDQHEGVVSAIEARFTVLKTFDGEQVLIPNADIISKAVIRKTAYEFRRSKIEICLEYKVDLKKLIKRFGTVIRETEGVLEKPEPKVFLDSFEEGKIKLIFFFWTKSEREYERSTHSLVVENIKNVIVQEKLLEFKPTIK